MSVRQFFDRAAANWDADTPVERVDRLRAIMGGLGIAPGDRVLDVGCGTGVLTPLLREHVGEKGCIVALDLSGEMLRRARRKGAPAGYVQGEAERLPLSAQTFDWIICYATFPHLADKNRALAEIRRVMRAGGRLLIVHTASREQINTMHRAVGGFIAGHTIPDAPEMRRLLASVGLRELDLRDEADCYLALARRDLPAAP